MELKVPQARFPCLRAGTFIEAPDMAMLADIFTAFPSLRAGTFIEAVIALMGHSVVWAISPSSGGDFH